MKEFLKDYIETLKKDLESMPLKELRKVIDIIFGAYKNKKIVFLMGNGGSAATASHFACDLGKNVSRHKNKRIKVICLNDNIPLLTAISNDYGYKHVFKEQLINLLHKDDVVVVFSASGNSENLVEAVKYAKKNGAKTVGIIGFGGGKIKRIADECIYLRNYDYGRIESIHLLIEHFITECLKRKINQS